ncbi:MAG: cytochrome c oxidase subunit 3 [Myxococcota bacterium]
MRSRALGPVRVVSASDRQPVVPNGVLGMLIFVVTESMLFAGLISAFTIIRASAIVWPPPDQPRLPLEQTALNTAALLGSGVLLYLARRRLSRDPQGARTMLLGAMLLGGFFVVMQGAEWVALISQGLTLTSSTLGGFFYLIVGIHGLHAVAALAVLAQAWWRMQRGWMGSAVLAPAEVFWYFVVAVWPVLYLRVYL